MIQIEHLQKIVDRRTVLDIDALVVPSGEIAAVVGGTGSGIETLFDLVIGKLSPSAGTVRLAQVEPGERAAFSRKVGILFAEDALYRFSQGGVIY